MIGFLATHASPELRQQRPGLLEIRGVQPLREPLIDIRQHRPCFVSLAVLLPQATQAHRRSQFQGFGVLAAGNCQGLEETVFRQRLVRASQQQLAAQAMQLGRN